MDMTSLKLVLDTARVHNKRRSVILALAFLWVQAAFCADASLSSTDFAAKALPSLPIEERYQFRKAIAEELHRAVRDAAARPSSAEVVIEDTGWRVVIPSASGPVLRGAAEDFRDYLAKAMGVRVGFEQTASLADWKQRERIIIVATRDQLPGCGAELVRRKDYQIVVSDRRIAVCGYDERGAMYGLYNLEARMNLREAPFLPGDLNTTRHSLYTARLTLSGLGWDQWPDEYLATLAHYGIDAIYASTYHNPNGYPNPRRDFYLYANQDPACVRDIIRRAARYGIDVYCPIIWLYTGEPENAAGLRMLVRDIVRTFPEIRGYVLLNEGFTAPGFPGWDQSVHHQRNWIEQWARAIAIVAEECHRINPAIELLAWDYGVDTRPYPDKIDTKRFVIDQYPRDVIPLVTWENGKRFELDGEPGYVLDYSISEVGPAEGAAAQIERARQRGLPAVYAKADTWASWTFGTFPYLPFPYQWYERYRMLEKYGIEGVLESWSYGFKPNFVAELRAWYSWSDAPPLDALLRAIARREFGSGSEAWVLAAWDHFSRAIRHLPDTGSNIGTTVAVAQPFFFEKPTRPRTRTLENSWHNQALWMQQAGINPYWPYVFAFYLLWPDFTNQVNVAELYARLSWEKNGPYFTLPVYMKYLLRAADEMEAGLVSYRQAALRAPESRRYRAFREVLLAEQLQRMLRSDQAMLEFEDLRFRLAQAGVSQQGQMLDRMSTILKEEFARTTAARETALRDSRLGYEWEQDYFYTPDTLEEKLKLLRVTLDEQIPAYRKQHALQ